MAYKAFLGSAQATTSGNTLVITTTAAVDVGDLIVVYAAADNLSATTPTFTAIDGGANTYTTVVQKAQNATAGAGAACAIIVTRATTAMIVARTITVVLSAAVAVRAAYAESFTDTGIATRVVNSFSQSGAAQASTGAAAAQIGDLVVAVNAVETLAALTGDPDTFGGTWSTLRTQVASTGTSATSMTVAGQWKVPNVATNQTQGCSWTGTTDYAAAIAVFIPEVIAPPEPVPPGHVEIGGMLFCVPAHGVAVRIEVRTPTQLLDVTDSVVRATWQQGGTYDGGGSPWYNPTPNPCELELIVDNPLWDPTTIGAYDLTPLATNVKIYLAEEATFGSWAADIKFYGPLLAHTYEPTPGGGAVVQISAADALTNLGDMIADERGEEAPWQRLAWLATGVKDLAHSFAAGDGMDAPVLGRYHPDAGQTRLEMMTDAALACGQALMFQPTDYDEPPPITTLTYRKDQGKFSNPGVCFTAAVDPENGMVLTGGDAAFTPLRVACLTDIALTRQEQGFRSRIRSARTIAPWFMLGVNYPLQTLAAGSYFVETPAITADLGDRFEWRASSVGVVTWSTGNTYLLSMFYTNPTQNDLVAHSLVSGSAIAQSRTYTNDYGVNTNFKFGRWINTNGASFPAYHEEFHRLGGNGPEAETVDAARETAYGQRAVGGLRSPIARQADLVTWNSRALAWITQPTTYPRLLRVATSPAHPSPGAQQWAVHLVAGNRLALRHHPNPAAPNAATISTWAVNISTTLTPTELTLDVECGPRTSGSA